MSKPAVTSTIPGKAVELAGSTAAAVWLDAAQQGPARDLILVPFLGVLVHKGATHILA